MPVPNFKKRCVLMCCKNTESLQKGSLTHGGELPHFRLVLLVMLGNVH